MFNLYPELCHKRIAKGSRTKQRVRALSQNAAASHRDHASAQISALSKPGSRWCCNNTDKSERSGARSGRRRRGRHRLGVQTHGVGRYQYVARQKKFVVFFFTSWRCLRTLTCLGKTKEKKNISYLCCDWLLGDGLAQAKREIRRVCVCGMLDRCAKMGEVPRVGCSQSLRVHQFFGDVEGSGSAVSLGDRREKREMDER